MNTYCGQSSLQRRAWQDEVAALSSALETLRSAMAHVRDDLQVPGLAMTYEEALETVVADVEHLDGVFVQGVADGLAEADDAERYAGYWVYPDEVVEADEDAFDPGVASLSDERTDAGEGDAAELVGLLDEMGLLDDEAAWAAIDPADPDAVALVALLEEIGGQMDHPAYSAAFYNSLGAEGTWALLAILDNAYLYDPDLADNDRREIADPLVAGFALASGSLDPEVVEGLFHRDEPYFSGDSDPLLLGILLTAPGDLYDPVFLADAADSMLMPEGSIGFPEAAAMRALAENPDAAWYFASKSDDHVALLFYTPDIESMLHSTPESDVRAEAWLGMDAQDTDAFHELYSLWTASALLHATGIPVTYQDENGNPIEFGWRDGLSLGADFAPFVGTGKAWVELTTGSDPITGDDINPWIAAVGVIPLASIAKGFKKFFKFTKILPDRGPRTAHEGIEITESAPSSPASTGSQGWYHVEPLEKKRISDHGHSVATLEDEMRKAGIEFDLANPPQPGSQEFDQIVDYVQANDATLDYVVRQDGTLVVAPEVMDGTKISHEALRGVDETSPIVAAGSFEIAGVDAKGNYIVSKLDNNSGHFEPDISTVHEIVVPALEQSNLSWDTIPGDLI